MGGGLCKPQWVSTRFPYMQGTEIMEANWSAMNKKR